VRNEGCHYVKESARVEPTTRIRARTELTLGTLGSHHSVAELDRAVELVERIANTLGKLVDLGCESLPYRCPFSEPC
jgi:hypothetical protein